MLKPVDLGSSQSWLEKLPFFSAWQSAETVYNCKSAEKREWIRGHK